MRRMSATSLQDLRAWQTCRAFKLAIYRLCDTSSVGRDPRLRTQLCEAAASAASQVAEGFGRFNPADFARFLAMARASLVEAQNHLQDAVDRGHICEDAQADSHSLAQAALRDVTSLLEYLQSPRAQENARKVRAKRQARRTQNPEPRTKNPEPEPRTRPRNSDHRTQNTERRTATRS
jgi:four helix bundle protein